MGGLLQMLLAPQTRATKVDPKHPKDPGLIRMFGLGTVAASGVTVTADTAMRVAAVYACVRLIAESIASLPLMVYRRQADGWRERDPRHPLWEVLHDQPNRVQTAVEFWEMVIAHAVLRGNGLAQIVPAPARAVGELVPLHSDRVFIFRAPDGRRAYAVTPDDGAPYTLLQHEVFHVPGLSFDGVSGINPIEYARESVGLAIAAEAFGARSFANDARPGGVLTHPETLSEEAQARIVKSWEDRMRGVQNANRLVVLEEGLKFQAISIAQKDAQYLESRKFQVTDISRWFRCPPHMIGDLERATFSNIEQQGIDLVVYTLRPWIVRIEQAIRRDLLTGSGRQTHFAAFVVDGLLRGDIESRYKAYGAAIKDGHMTRNEVREMENRNPLPGLDAPLVPLNMGGATEVAERALTAACDRAVRKEVAALARDGVDDGAFYRDFADFIAQATGCAADTAARWVSVRRELWHRSEDRPALLADWRAAGGGLLADYIRKGDDT